MKKLLIRLEACEPALEWAGNKTWEEVYNTCHRGDWLLWLHNRTNKEDLQVRTLAKGHCANTVRYLMQDERSLKAVDTAIAFGEGRSTRAELDASYYDAVDGARAAYAATYAAYSAAAAYASYSVSVATDDDATIVAADTSQNQKETADIVRKYIPIELWNVNKMIDELKLEKEVNNGKEL